MTRAVGLSVHYQDILENGDGSIGISVLIIKVYQKPLDFIEQGVVRLF